MVTTQCAWVPEGGRWRAPFDLQWTCDVSLKWIFLVLSHWNWGSVCYCIITLPILNNAHNKDEENGKIKGVLMKDYIKDVVKLLHQRGLFEWSDGHRSQVWRLRGEEVVLCQCQVLSQHVCPRDGGNNRDVFFAQRVTLEPPVYLRLLLFLPPSFIFTPVILVHHVHTS